MISSPARRWGEIDEAICECGFDFPDCPVHLAYIFACQAVHLRDRLKMYEDTGLMPDDVTDLMAEHGTAIAALAEYRALGTAKKLRALIDQPNAPLTLEELREMDGEPVWNDTMKKWVIVDLFWEHGPRTVDARGRWRDLEDRYYRCKPEEGI